MKLTRFGDAFETAYHLGDVKAEVGFSADRPPLLARAGAASGAYDFYGDDPYPIKDRVIQLTFSLTARAYSTVDEALTALYAATLARGRSKLWLTLRDEQTRRWAWAKCVGIKHDEAAGQNYTALPVTLTFVLPEGVWYGETQRSFTSPTIAQGTLTYQTALINGGSLPAPVYIEVAPSASGVFSSVQATNAANNYRWTFSGSPDQVGAVYVDSGKFECKYLKLSPFQIKDGYAYLAYGALVPQTNWMLLLPGSNTVTIDITMSASDAWFVIFQWYDVFV